MKMKKAFSLKSISVVVISTALFASCSKSNESSISSSDSKNTNSESVSESYTSETSDMGNSVISNVSNSTYANGRVSGDITSQVASKDGRLAGATITITHTGCTSSTLDSPCGQITIDFGAGVTTNGVTRKGKIIISYSGRKNAGQSTRTIGYSGYSRNGVVFDDAMQFKLTNTGAQGTVDSTHFNHQLIAGKLTFPDNTTILRVANYNVTLDFVAKTITLSANSNAAHSASGSTREQKDYTMDITTPLVYKGECVASKVFIPVSGVKTITVNNLITYSIDYGDGTCDNTVKVTVGGKTYTITTNSDGN